MMLGGDHGKGELVRTASIIVRYKDEFINPKILDLQIGGIVSEKDFMQHLLPLLLMMKTGILKLHPNSDGNTEVIVTGLKFDTHTYSYSYTFARNLGTGLSYVHHT
mmetsp:Transcript_28619/g.33956  ORF Transcript_28619/g.33956 Transcript_28619/m.33956 type:complete len:106 (+) Transcript_28619:237-554(+)